MKSIMFLFSLFILIASAACRTMDPQNSNLRAKEDIKDLPEEERNRYIADSDAWLEDPDVATKNIAAGPAGPFATTSLTTLSCDFVEPDPKDPPGGRTPKFECEFELDGKKKAYKVKYDPASVMIDGKSGTRNLEVWGEVLATRLLWALGFPADRIYPARIECRSCPLDPWTYIRKKTNVLDTRDNFIGFVRADLIKSPRLEERATAVFDPAVIEVKYDGPKIESTQDSGWGWSEIYSNMSDPSRQRLHRDGLTIVAAFINHMDNKAEQQRLVCRSKKDVVEGHCTKPLLMIQDAGSSFGLGWAPFQGAFRLNKVDLDKWVKLSIWADRKQCVVKINGAPNASLRVSQQVSEEARAWIASLFARLSDQQLIDLFATAQMDKLGGPSVNEWVSGFKEKVRRDLFEARCGS